MRNRYSTCSMDWWPHHQFWWCYSFLINYLNYSKYFIILQDLYHYHFKHHFHPNKNFLNIFQFNLNRCCWKLRTHVTYFFEITDFIIVIDEGSVQKESAIATVIFNGVIALYQIISKLMSYHERFLNIGYLFQ